MLRSHLVLNPRMLHPSLSQTLQLHHRTTPTHQKLSRHRRQSPGKDQKTYCRTPGIYGENTKMTKPTISLVVATDGICNVRCKTCPTGRNEDGVDAGRMSLDTFKRIVDKAQAESHVLSCCLYYFNEPLLHPEIVGMMQYLKEKKLYTFVSTNLSFQYQSAAMVRAKQMMELGVENIIVSVSGWNQDTYERSHKNGNIEWVKANMQTIARIRTRKTSMLRLSWHVYDYNTHERYLMEDYASHLGFKFTPYGTGVLPLERTLARWQDNLPDPAEADIMVKLPEAKKLCRDRKHWDCEMQRQTFTVGSTGEVYNCSDRNSPANWRGNFFKDGTVAQFLKRRVTDPDCVACKKVGGHIYAAQEYTTPLNNPMRHAKRLYRQLHLQRALQTLYPYLWRKSVEGFYNRPQKNIPLTK